MGGEQQPQGGKPQPQSRQSRRERREQRRKQMQQQARGGGQQSQSQPPPKNDAGKTPMGTNAGQPGMGGINSDRQPDHLSDVAKDFWGHLPETLRQEVDHYYRDRFMPRTEICFRDIMDGLPNKIAPAGRTADGRLRSDTPPVSFRGGRFGRGQFRSVPRTSIAPADDPGSLPDGSAAKEMITPDAQRAIDAGWPTSRVANAKTGRGEIGRDILATSPSSA